MTPSTDPLEALAAVQQTDQKMAERMRWPLWRHAAAGALQGTFVFVWATPMPYAAILLALCIASLFVIIESDRRNHGMFVSGWASAKARPATLCAVAISLLGFAAVIYASDGINQWTNWAVPIALAVALGVTCVSVWWEKLYQRELAEEGVRS